MMTPSLEDYLEKIYFIRQRNDTVRVTDLAIEMNISKPSVNKAINTLKSQGYVNHEHYGTLSLTPSGLEIAKDIANRHMLIKRFLTDILHVDEDIAENEACHLEHSISKNTVDRLEKHIKSMFPTQGDL